MNSVLTKDLFLENLLQIEQTGQCTPDRAFKGADRQVASLLRWWYQEHPNALPDIMSDFSALPWHTLKAIGHLMFSQEADMASRRKKYQEAYAGRYFEPWERFEETLEVPDRNLWEFAFDTAMALMREIEVKEGEEPREMDVLQVFFNFRVAHETIAPLPKNHQVAFPAREFNDLVWMDWRARKIFQEEKGLYPDAVGMPTISFCERKLFGDKITVLYIARRDYEDVGDIVAAFSGYDNNPVGDLKSMTWVKNMHRKAIPVLALTGFFLDMFKPEEIGLSEEVLSNLPKDPFV